MTDSPVVREEQRRGGRQKPAPKALPPRAHSPAEPTARKAGTRNRERQATQGGEQRRPLPTPLPGDGSGESATCGILFNLPRTGGDSNQAAPSLPLPEVHGKELLGRHWWGRRAGRPPGLPAGVSVGGVAASLQPHLGTGHLTERKREERHRPRGQVPEAPEDQ